MNRVNVGEAKAHLSRSRARPGKEILAAKGVRAMKPEDILEFARRPRRAVEQAKLDHWAALQRSSGGQATLTAGHALFQHARRLRPEFPTAADRAEDLAHHIRLKRLIDAAKDAFPVRRPPR